jgi:hypothetical protein
MANRGAGGAAIGAPVSRVAVSECERIAEAVVR